ncbi:MAG TPA: hypothetical protein P5232_03300 [Candidatus Moranbacteria bacterium]|nr:hypothetical protein [Candidatus Moranbacteria bacterium]
MEEEKDIVKSKVMQAIKEKRIKMRSHFVFVAEKLGLESALAVAIILGAFFISILFYFFKKTGLLKFLSLGIPGLKIFLLTLPYEYIALFILFIILAIYFANQFELCCGNCTHTNSFAICFFALSLILGICFGAIGVGEYLKGWSKKDIPKENAIHGKVKNFSDKEILIEDEDGKLIRVFIETPESVRKDKYEEEKFLRAIGNRDLDDENLFHAQIIRCCDED